MAFETASAKSADILPGPQTDTEDQSVKSDARMFSSMSAGKSGRPEMIFAPDKLTAGPSLSDDSRVQYI